MNNIENNDAPKPGTEKKNRSVPELHLQRITLKWSSQSKKTGDDCGVHIKIKRVSDTDRLRHPIIATIYVIFIAITIMLAAGANVNVDLLRVTAFAVVIALFTFAVSQLTFTNPTRELRVLVKLSEIGPTSQYNPDNWHEFLVDLISELYEVRSLSRYHCLLLLDWINTKDIDPSDLKQLAFNLRALLYPMPPHQFGKVLYRFRKERRILYK